MAAENQSQDEQELQFKKRARRRLVGAIALVLLMIIFLPMVLQDRSTQTPPQDIIISIPNQDTPLTPQTPPVKDKNATASPEAPVVASQVNADANAASSAQSSAPTSSAGTADSSSPKPETKDSVTDSNNKSAQEDVSGNYMIQIGVFSDPENVKQMQAKLNSKGIKSRADLIDTAKGKKTRLRIGPFSDKAQASATLDKIKPLNMSGVIVSIGQ
jgi:DedD protein